MKTFWRVIYFAGAVSALMFLGLYLSESESSDNTNTTNSELAQFNTPVQVGYFKSDNNHRVFTFTIDRRMPESEIKNHAENRMHTSGRTTYAFYYYNDAPNPTQANNLDRALQITENSDFRYSFMKLGNGSVTFTSHR